MNITRNEMLYHLRNDVCTVVFEKADGTERTMKCTLVENRIPGEKKPKGSSTYSEHVIRVYDVEADGWRSFKVAAVKSFELPDYVEWSPEAQDTHTINSVRS